MQEIETPHDQNIKLVKSSELPEYPNGKVGEKESAKLTKRQLKNIARRSGKTKKELEGLRDYLKYSGREPKIAYLVVAE